MRLQDVKGDEDWSALEAELLRCAPLGLTAGLPGKQDCPKDTTDPDRRVRAGLIRWLLLGGDDIDGVRTHTTGLMLCGASVQGTLDFHGCKTRLDCSLVACLFLDPVVFLDAELRGLYLPGSHCRQGLTLQRLKTATNVHLRKGFLAIGLVDLAAAQIGGQLDCSEGQFLNLDRTAFNCEAAQVGANVFLRQGFKAEGKVAFGGATVEGSLQIRQSTLDGGFDGRDMTVKAGFFWQDVTGTRKTVDLRHASFGVLRDDKASWDGVGTLHLDGLSYDRIDSAMTVGERLTWLARKRERPMPFVHPSGPGLMPWLDLGDGFDPQPYTQLARVLTAAGNRSGAARVRRVREGLLSQAEYRRSLARLDGSVRAGFVSLGGAMRRRWDVLFRWMFGYGHAPARVFWWIGGLLMLTAALFGHIYDMGQMAPNSAVILTSTDWQAALRAAGDAGQPLFHWAGMHGHPPMPSAIDHETFSSLLYAFDLFIPLDAIGQQQAWAPSHDRGFWGAVGYWARFPIQVAGWVIAAVGAAVVTGLLGKKDDG